jgi:hypothetical protein
MNYSLGNMLSRGGSLNADGLSLDLQFATDKTLVARKGPTPTFTRASTATFVGSNGLIQSAAINEPRFDHDPVTLASKGLLIEESRTNLALQSENHPSATWSKTGLTIASASNTNPAGNATSNLVSEDSSVGLHRLFQSTAYVSGTSYSISVFLKYAGRQFVAVNHPTVAANGLALFDIQNGTITLSQAGITSSITSYPNGWYRCVVTGVSSTTGGSSHIIQGSTTGGVLTGSYTGLNGAAFYIYGSQVEAGSLPTSYIPTTTASVVRSADVCSITGSDFTGMYSDTEGSTYVESIPTVINGTATALSLSNGLSTERWLVRFLTSEQAVITSAGTESTLDALNPVAGTSYRIATAAKLNDFAMSIDGLAVVTDTSQPMPVVNRLGIGTSLGSSGAVGGTVTIASIRYFKKRLSNAKLQTLTA